MSYGFKVIKDVDTIRLEDVTAAALEHIPNGTFHISGHRASPNTSDVESIGVQLTDPDFTYRASSQGGTRVPLTPQEVTE